MKVIFAFNCLCLLYNQSINIFTHTHTGETSRFERNECEKPNQGPEKPLSGDFRKKSKKSWGSISFLGYTISAIEKSGHISNMNFNSEN